MVEEHLMERVIKSLWCAIQVDQSTDGDKEITMLTFVYIFKRTYNVHICCKPASHLHLYKSWITYLRTEFIFFCVRIHLDGVIAFTGQISLLIAKGLLLHLSLHFGLSVEKCWLSEHHHLNWKTFCMKLLQLWIPLKHISLHLFRQLCGGMNTKAHIFSSAQKWYSYLNWDPWPEFLSYGSCFKDLF